MTIKQKIRKLIISEYSPIMLGEVLEIEPPNTLCRNASDFQCKIVTKIFNDEKKKETLHLVMINIETHFIDRIKESIILDFWMCDVFRDDLYTLENDIAEIETMEDLENAEDEINDKIERRTEHRKSD